ncbi:glycosyltransferase [Burkholderia sp. MSMB1589WGS]|uniref:tetratricopeptide repeat-containing glycosyltransferase n=1 Tax=Burkholderia sp. MSMB1589WGS TaxID=1636425 RepID=UPI0007B7FEAB|nr:glycosyltransferase [Burkholderia sp. MSMB1589WGS]
MARICLNMIVKNEAAVMSRCLESVRPWIDHWVIVDTGSTDGTQKLVRELMHDVPGSLHERPWHDFAHNRNEALMLARDHGDYLLFIDADETLDMPDGFGWPDLNDEAYQFLCELNGWRYLRNALVSTRRAWRWEGVLHEYLTCDQPHKWQKLPGPTIVVAHDGARGRNPDTYLHDVEVLEEALRREPGNSRYRFYLAQSYRDAGKPEAALYQYRARLSMGGWDEECWFCLFQIAVLSERLAMPPREVCASYLAAYQARPRRAEPLCELARYHRLRGEYALAHVYAQQAAAIAMPADSLFVDGAVYAWRARDELAISAFYVGAFAQGKEVLLRMLHDQEFPDDQRVRLEQNLQCYLIREEA